MKISVIVYRRNQNEKSGILKIRIQEGTKRKFVSLNENIKLKDFDGANEKIKKTNPQHEYLNDLIEKALANLKQADNKFKFVKNSNITFNQYQSRYVDKHANHGSRKKYTTVIRLFSKFLKDKKGRLDYKLSDIDDILIEEFKSYLFTEQTLRESTKFRYLKILKTIINAAIKDKIVSYQFHPFTNIEIKTISSNKVFLNEDEIYRIKKLKYGNIVDQEIQNLNDDFEDIRQELNPKHYTAISDFLYITQQMCLLQLSAQGIRVSDLLLLRPAYYIDGYFEFQMHKTKKRIRVHLNEFLIQILTNILKFNFVANEYDEFGVEEENLFDNNLDSILHNTKELAHLRFNDKEKNSTLINVLVSSNKTMMMDNLELLKLHFPNKFIIPFFLNEGDFKNYFKSNLMGKYEYNQLSSKEALYNKRLKTIQENAKISKTLTSHVFRHTFANLALSNQNADLYSISKALGHSSLSETEVYLRDFDSAKVERMVNEMVEKIVDLGSVLKNPWYSNEK